MKPNHGGKRKNAGRKPLPVPKKAISAKLDAADIAELNAICERRRMSQAGLIAEWIQAEPQQPMKTYEELKAENEAQAAMIIKLRDELTKALESAIKQPK